MALVCFLALSDVIALSLASILAYFVRAADIRPFAYYVSLRDFSLLVVLLAPWWIAIMAACGLYSTRPTLRRIDVVGRVLVAVVGGVASFIVIDYLTPNTSLFPSRSVPPIAAAFGVLFVLAGRELVQSLFSLARSRGKALHRVVLVGAGPLADRIGADLVREGSTVVATVALNADPRSALDLPVFTSVEEALAAHPRADEVVLVDSGLSRPEVVELMTIATTAGIGFRFVPDLFGVFASASTMSTLGGIPVMEVRLTALDGWAAVGKRLVDVAGAVVGLVLFAPLFAAVALAIKVSDPAGPVFYRQTRLGRGGRPIRVWKFRSMTWKWSVGPDRPYQDAADVFIAMGRPDLAVEFQVDQKVADDPRVSPVGRFLRRTSLDELPQFLNALVGDLSLVGPRPITSVELERYGSHADSFLALKPGITGLWQVSGRSDIGYDERVKLDVFYVENWKPSLDASILVRTFLTVAARKGAY